MRRYATALLCGGTVADTVDGRGIAMVSELAGRFAERTVFTRFIPPEKPTDLPGMWQRYYTRWPDATREHLNPVLLDGSYHRFSG